MVATAALGPWNGGLNLTSNRDLSVFLQNNELGEATNVIYSKEGFVQPRPGCKMLLNNGGLYAYAQFNYKMDVLGQVKLSTGELVTIIQVRNDNGVHLYKAIDRDNVTLYWVQNGTNFWFNHIIVYEGGRAGHKGIMFFAEQPDKSYVTEDMTLTTEPTLIPATNKVPGSSGGLIVKDRLFLWKNEESKFMWSPASYVLDWTGIVQAGQTNGTDVSNFVLIEPTTANDGIMSVQFINNNFYIFKKNKTYMYTYQDLPVEDGYLRKINTEMGAFASTMYRNQIVVINNRGVFKIDTTEFIDLQPQLNLRFEVPLDHTNFTTEQIFITDFNNDILLGFVYTDTSQVKHYFHYCMNGYTGAWSKWTFDYNTDEAPSPTRLAAPGTRQYRGQALNTVNQCVFFSTFDRKHIVFMDWKPREASTNLGHYHSDTNCANIYEWDRYYIPEVIVKTRAAIGTSAVSYKKVYRTYVRFYLSDVLATMEQYPKGIWTFSVNYDDYRFSVDKSHDTEQLLFLYPTEDVLPVKPNVRTTTSTAVYQRTYQLPIHQFRALEYVFELKRRWTSTTDLLTNPDIDDPIKPVKKGYWFSLAGIIYDFEDKAKM